MAITGIGNSYNSTVRGEVIPDISERKFMNRVDKGEKVNLFHENPNGVSVELSEEGLKKLSEDALSVKQDGKINLPGSYEERVKFLKESLKPAQKLHRIIPNIQTNDKLEKSLQGADESISDAAYSIIRNDLIPHNVGNLTEDERIELISVGLEKAKYLADRLEDDKAGIFMEAMNTIARYGINGKTDLQGNVTYDIRWGAMVGAPDDYISSGELMQRISPEQYKIYSSMWDEAIEKNDEGLVLKATKFAIEWEMNAYKTNPKPFEELKTEQVNWKKSVDNTKINSSYNDTDRSNMGTFVNSILQQNKVLNAEHLADNLQKFAKFFDVSF